MSPLLSCLKKVKRILVPAAVTSRDHNIDITLLSLFVLRITWRLRLRVKKIQQMDALYSTLPVKIRICWFYVIYSCRRWVLTDLFCFPYRSGPDWSFWFDRGGQVSSLPSLIHWVECCGSCAVLQSVIKLLSIPHLPCNKIFASQVNCWARIVSVI